MNAPEGTLRKTFLFNLIVVLLLCVGLYILFFASLRWVTNHGKEVKIPNVVGSDIKSAMIQLKAIDFDVYVDSTYEPQQKPLAVLQEVPEVGSVVKPGRTIFITVNKAVAPETAMPNLISLSYRSAEMLLRNNKLIVGDTTYKPDIADGAILAQLYNGKDIKPGDMVPEGSKINLVIGNGLGNTEFNVPNVIGMSYVEGTTYLAGNSLQYAIIPQGDITDTASAIIIDQSPKPFNEL